MLTVFARTAILYAVSVLAMRLMGKRQVGQLQPYELVLALMIAERWCFCTGWQRCFPCVFRPFTVSSPAGRAW